MLAVCYCLGVLSIRMHWRLAFQGCRWRPHCSVLGSSEDMLVLWADGFCFEEAGEEVGILKLFLIMYSLDMSSVPVRGCFKVFTQKHLSTAVFTAFMYVWVRSPTPGARNKFSRCVNRNFNDLSPIKVEQAPEDSEEQGSLVCCSPWGRKESDMTALLNSGGPRHMAVLRSVGPVHSQGQGGHLHVKDGGLCFVCAWSF